MKLVTDGTRLSIRLPGLLEAYEGDEGIISIWDPERKRHVSGLTWKTPRDAWAAALCNLGYEGADFDWELRGGGEPSKFKVGDTITYYDVNTDQFTSREVLFIHEGWAVVPGTLGAKAPVALTPLAAAEPHKADPIKPGDRVRRGWGDGVGTVVDLAAWVNFDNGEDAGHVVPLSQLDHAR